MPIILALLFAATLSRAQPPEPSFEVATVKLSKTPPPGLPNSDGGPGTRDPIHYAAYATLRTFLFRAFGLVDALQQISGPSWIDSEKYAIEARVPEGATREQFQIMLRNLLIERFQLQFHRDTRLLSVYYLTVSRNGPKLKQSTPDPAAQPVAPSIDRDRDGFPVIPAGRSGLISGYGPGTQSRWTARQEPLAALARALGAPLATGLPVIDQTGLTGAYDFNLSYDFQTPGAPAPDVPVTSIFDALEQQLGLKLTESKASFDQIVIDRAERTPAGN